MRRELEQEYVDYVSAHLPALRRLAYVLCADWHHADDVVQTAVTKLYISWPRVKKAGNVDGYVRAMLVNAFLDERRRSWAKVWLPGSLPEPRAAPETDPGDRDMLRSALYQLPPRQRAVLVLRFYCDLSVDAVAELLGCAPGTVKATTAHGLAAMRRILHPGQAQADAETRT